MSLSPQIEKFRKRGQELVGSARSRLQEVKGRFGVMSGGNPGNPGPKLGNMLGKFGMQPGRRIPKPIWDKLPPSAQSRIGRVRATAQNGPLKGLLKGGLLKGGFLQRFKAREPPTPGAERETRPTSWPGPTPGFNNLGQPPTRWAERAAVF